MPKVRKPCPKFGITNKLNTVSGCYMHAAKQSLKYNSKAETILKQTVIQFFGKIILPLQILRFQIDRKMYKIGQGVRT